MGHCRRRRADCERRRFRSDAQWSAELQSQKPIDRWPDRVWAAPQRGTPAVFEAVSQDGTADMTLWWRVCARYPKAYRNVFRKKNLPGQKP